MHVWSGEMSSKLFVNEKENNFLTVLSWQTNCGSGSAHSTVGSCFLCRFHFWLLRQG